MIVPLFEGMRALMSSELSVSILEKVYLLWKGTFKRFMLIPKSHPRSEITYQMIGIDFVDLLIKNKEEALMKWDQRKRRIKISFNESNKVLRLNWYIK